MMFGERRSFAPGDRDVVATATRHPPALFGKRGDPAAVEILTCHNSRVGEHLVEAALTTHSMWLGSPKITQQGGEIRAFEGDLAPVNAWRWVCNVSQLQFHRFKRIWNVPNPWTWQISAVVVPTDTKTCNS